jgi:hypothetical protein
MAQKLFLFLVQRHFVATGTEFLDFHPVRMVLLVFAAEVILFTADGAFPDKVVAHTVILQ